MTDFRRESDSEEEQHDDDHGCKVRVINGAVGSNGDMVMKMVVVVRDWL